jgi:hypothetical protein
MRQGHLQSQKVVMPQRPRQAGRGCQAHQGINNPRLTRTKLVEVRAKGAEFHNESRLKTQFTAAALIMLQ